MYVVGGRRSAGGVAVGGPGPATGGGVRASNGGVRPLQSHMSGTRVVHSVRVHVRRATTSSGWATTSSGRATTSSGPPPGRWQSPPSLLAIVVGGSGSSQYVSPLVDGEAVPGGWGGIYTWYVGCHARGGLSHDRTRCKSEGVCNSCQMTGTSGYGMAALPVAALQ